MDQRLALGITHYNRSQSLMKILKYIRHIPSNYDLLIVDDSSTETEYDSLLKFLQTSNLQYKILRHKENRGPGGAKNSLFEMGKHDYIFILDSDNFIDSSSLQYIANCVKTHNDDLVAPSEIRYFSKTLNNFTADFQRKPSLSNLSTYIFGDQIYNNGNMLVSRNAWKKVSGYPTHHTLDTQGFGFRLRLENLAYRCVKGASYYHKRHPNPRNSRFMQTSMSGSISIEQSLILLEGLDNIPISLYPYILEYPIFQQKQSWDNSLFTHLSSEMDKLLFINQDPSSLNSAQRRIEQIQNFLFHNNHGYKNKKTLCTQPNKSDFEILIKKLGENFTSRSCEQKKQIINSILTQYSGHF